jgi:putative selenate reductase
VKRWSVGEHVIVVGVGNTAMDAARAAKRIKALFPAPSLRRNKRYIPRTKRTQLAEDEGVAFRELL